VQRVNQSINQLTQAIEWDEGHWFGIGRAQQYVNASLWAVRVCDAPSDEPRRVLLAYTSSLVAEVQ